MPKQIPMAPDPLKSILKGTGGYNEYDSIPMNPAGFSPSQASFEKGQRMDEPTLKSGESVYDSKGPVFTKATGEDFNSYEVGGY